MTRSTRHRLIELAVSIAIGLLLAYFMKWHDFGAGYHGWMLGR